MAEPYLVVIVAKNVMYSADPIKRIIDTTVYLDNHNRIPL